MEISGADYLTQTIIHTETNLPKTYGDILLKIPGFDDRLLDIKKSLFTLGFIIKESPNKTARNQNSTSKPLAARIEAAASLEQLDRSQQETEETNVSNADNHHVELSVAPAEQQKFAEQKLKESVKAREQRQPADLLEEAENLLESDMVTPVPLFNIVYW